MCVSSLGPDACLVGTGELAVRAAGGRGYLLTSRAGVFAAASLGMLLFGVTLTTLGAVLPPLIRQYGLEKADAGIATRNDEPGYPGGVAGFRAGGRPPGIASADDGDDGVGLGLTAIAWATRATVLTPAMLAFGFGGGLLNGATTRLLPTSRRRDAGRGWRCWACSLGSEHSEFRWCSVCCCNGRTTPQSWGAWRS